MNLKERLAAQKAARAAKVAEADALIKAIEESVDGKPTAEQSAQFDAIELEIGTLDADITAVEKMVAAQTRMSLVPVTQTDPVRTNTVPPGSAVMRQPVPLPKGTMFGRYALAMVHANGDLNLALQIAERWKDSTPEVGAFIAKAAVAAGVTTVPAWAGALTQPEVLGSEYIELLMPETVVGQISGKKQIPFNVKIPRMTGGVTAQWVGEGLSKPVGAGAFDMLTNPWAKLSIITVMSEEVIRFSNPDAAAVMTQNMIDSIALEYNNQFLNGGAPSPIKPGGIFDGVVAVPSTGGTVDQITADVNALLGMIAATNAPLVSPYWIMSHRTFGYLASLRVAMGTAAFPGLSGNLVTPGSSVFFGIPVLVSGQVPINLAPGTASYIGLVSGGHIFWSQDPNVDVVTSREASLQMDSAPATPPTPLTSLFQQNLVAIRAEQFVYWQRRFANPNAGFGKITGVLY
jgi:HK97 family phage major capsid protein